MPHVSLLLHNRVIVARKYILLTSGEEAKQIQESNRIQEWHCYQSDEHVCSCSRVLKNTGEFLFLREIEERCRMSNQEGKENKAEV